MKFTIISGAALGSQLSIATSSRVFTESALTALVTVSPCGRPIVVNPRVNKLHTCTRPFGPVWPITVVRIIHLVSQIAIGILKPEHLARVAQLPAIIPDDVGRLIHALDVLDVRRHHEVVPGLDGCAGRECKIHTFGEPPTGEVDLRIASIVQFDKLATSMISRRIVHDLVDDHVFIPLRIVIASARAVAHDKPLVAAIGICLCGAFIIRATRRNPLHHRASIKQKKRHLPARIDVNLHHSRAPCRHRTCQLDPVGKITPRGQRQAFQTHRAFTRVVNLNPVHTTVLGEMNLVQAKRLAKRVATHVGCAWRGIGEQVPLGCPRWFAADRPTVE